MRGWRRAAGLVVLVVLTGCGGPVPRPNATQMNLLQADLEDQSAEARIDGVTAALLALGPGVDRDEAARVAEIAVRRSLVWAREWQVVDPPLRHNFKVIHGMRDKGVCRDWTNALHEALRQAGLRTLKLHVGVANARNVALEHVSVIVSARGAPMESGVVLDPWRIGQGRLWYGPVADDPRYRWETLEAVRAWQAEMKARIPR